ncbi:MAG: hypothetical protein LBK65_10180 [Tannerellaceae bacterium]|jgi:hypothetical protein|nr:hypothetical protein [Tannerellaceae bacterium]
MVIYDKSGGVVLDIQVDDESFRYRSIRKDNTVTLYYSLTQHVEVTHTPCVDSSTRYCIRFSQGTLLNASAPESGLDVEKGMAKKYIFAA